MTANPARSAFLFHLVMPSSMITQQNIRANPTERNSGRSDDTTAAESAAIKSSRALASSFTRSRRGSNRKNRVIRRQIIPYDESEANGPLTLRSPSLISSEPLYGN